MDEQDEPAGASIFGPSQASTPRPSSPPSLDNVQEVSTGDGQHPDAKAGRSLSPVAGPSKVDYADFDDDDRLDQFQGLASTWYKYTTDERGLAASLDQQRASDLSVHLYNTHALKARVRDPARAAGAKPWRSKQAWIHRDEDGKLLWHPDACWSAWPLPATDVPRKDEGFGVDVMAAHDPETLRQSEPWHPSQDLQDELQAVMLRKAKERFRRRVWTTELHRDVVLRDEAGDEDANERESPLSADHGLSTSSLIADDEQAHELLRPALRHILTKFDDLLLALHKSRAGHRRQQGDQASSRSISQSARSRSRSQPTKSRTVSRSRTGKASVLNKHSDDSEPETSEDDQTLPERPTRPQRRPSGQLKHELGQRDWSDVLGMAAMTGWDPSIVDRAARRCADLFGERMTFRIMPETGYNAVEDETVHYQPDMVSVTDSEDEDEEDVEQELSPAYFCPFESCFKHHEAFELPYRWREHLKRVHKLSQAAIHDAEKQHLGLASSTEGLPQYSCPFTSCARHHEPFSLLYRWRRHLREVHKLSDATTRDAENQLSHPVDNAQSGGGEAPGSHDIRTAATTPETRSDDVEDLIGAVHTDGFSQPIHGQLARGKDVKGRRRRSTTGEDLGLSKKRRMADGNEQNIDDDLVIE